MQWYWWVAGGLVGAVVLASFRSLRTMAREVQFERARESFRLQRERLEAKFLDAAAATGKPRGLEWVDCSFERELELVRDQTTGELLGLAPMTVKFAAVAGGPMEGVEAVNNLRYATAVLRFEKGQWHTQGRALFNMHPDEAISHFAGQFERI